MSADDNNSYVEEFDTTTKTIQTFYDYAPTYGVGGLTAGACLIPMLDENAFVVTGGKINTLK